MPIPNTNVGFKRPVTDGRVEQNSRILASMLNKILNMCRNL